MYPEGFSTYVNVEGEITKKLCGARRPGHFRGVATVVTKLMNLSRADDAFFGQKDAQQVVVISRFVEDLAIPVTLHMVPICREETGLARSSRNQYLSVEEKEAARASRPTSYRESAIAASSVSMARPPASCSRETSPSSWLIA